MVSGPRRWIDDATLELFTPATTGKPWLVECMSCGKPCADVPWPVRDWHFVEWLCPSCTAESLRLAVLAATESAAP